MEWTFPVLGLATALRVFGPLLAPGRAALWLDVAGGLWVVSFVVFLSYYAPVLLRPRVDGQPG